MAFRMNRPLIKGSALHRKSALTPTVADTRTKADPSLVYAADELGKSTIPGAIDYEIKTLKELEYRKDKETAPQPWDDQPKDEEGIPGCMDSKATNYNETATVDDGSCEYVKEKEAAPTEEGGEVEFTSTEFKGSHGDPYVYRTTESGGYQYKCPTCNPPVNDWVDATNQSAIDAISEHDPSKKETIAQLRNSKIYRNAIPGGKIQTKLINNGFDPYKSI